MLQSNFLFSLGIRQEIQDIQDGKADPVNNVLKNAPHTMESVTADTWDRPYSRKQAAYPLVRNTYQNAFLLGISRYILPHEILNFGTGNNLNLKISASMKYKSKSSFELSYL